MSYLEKKHTALLCQQALIEAGFEDVTLYHSAEEKVTLAVTSPATKYSEAAIVILVCIHDKAVEVFNRDINRQTGRAMILERTPSFLNAIVAQVKKYHQAGGQPIWWS